MVIGTGFPNHHKSHSRFVAINDRGEIKIIYVSPTETGEIIRQLREMQSKAMLAVGFYIIYFHEGV